MKKIFVIGILLGLGPVNGQYLPNSSQPSQFATVYNPAFTGVENYGDLRLGYRYQWTGFGVNAPKFINILYNIRLNRPLDLNHNSLRTSVRNYKLPKARRIIHGMGASLFNEDVGIVNRLGGGINYSFHYPLIESKNIWVATGVSVALENTRVDFNSIYMGANPDPDSFYDKLMSNGANRMDLNTRAGLLFYSPVFYFGFCYLPIWKSSLRSSEGNFADSFYRGTTQAGISFPLNSTFTLKPSFLGIWQADNELLFDYSMKVFYQERVWLGVAYRSTKSGVGVLGLNLSKMFLVTYSYEVPTSAWQQFSDGSHELVLGIRLNNSKAYNQYLW
jgi:type IX secretion system PorP/SprF family membrane protein